MTTPSPNASIPWNPRADEITIFGGLSNPAVRGVHGHSNADQFLTGADTGDYGDYKNTISLDQVFAAKEGEHTRYSSLVLSTDGGTGSPRGAHTISFNEAGRPIPAEHKPKHIFDMLFVKSSKDAAKRLAMSKSALDDLMADARSLKRQLSTNDQERLQEYLDSVAIRRSRSRRPNAGWIYPCPRWTSIISSSI